MIKENQEAYENLFAGIWKQAVVDDVDSVISQLSSHGFNSAYKIYKKNVDEPLGKEDKRFNRIKKDIKDYSRIKSRDIEGRIQELVYEEAKVWPENQNYKLRDEEYNQTLKELKAEVKEFSEKRMAKRWMRIWKSTMQCLGT